MCCISVSFVPENQSWKEQPCSCDRVRTQPCHLLFFFVWRNTARIQLKCKYDWIQICHISDKHYWPSATESHACPHHRTASTVFTHDVVCFWSWASPSLLHTFFLTSFWFTLIWVSSVQVLLFQNWAGFYLVWSIESYRGFHLVVKPLYLLPLLCLHLEWSSCSWMLWRGFLYHGRDPAIIH